VSIIACAFTGPMPDNLSSSSREAEFMSIWPESQEAEIEVTNKRKNVNTRNARGLIIINRFINQF
jgi:hypothetical protein